MLIIYVKNESADHTDTGTRDRNKDNKDIEHIDVFSRKRNTGGFTVDSQSSSKKKLHIQTVKKIQFEP